MVASSASSSSSAYNRLVMAATGDRVVSSSQTRCARSCARGTLKLTSCRCHTRTCREKDNTTVIYYKTLSSMMALCYCRVIVMTRARYLIGLRAGWYMAQFGVLFARRMRGS
eukprot:1194380-Prorocentrum_minimum.AAC.1